MDQPAYHVFRWVGSDAPYIDKAQVERCGDAIIGCYGGSSLGGAFKNEDAALVLSAADGAWRFAALIDGHYTTESDELILSALEERRPAIVEALATKRAGDAFEMVRGQLLEAFCDEGFRAACRDVIGEASAIFVAQLGRFLFWFSVGDCLAFVLHPELGGLGQFAINQRKYYEWLGKSNAFDLEAPAFSSGVQELRGGVNSVVLATDGLYEYPGSPFEDPRAIYAMMGPEQRDLAAGVLRSLQAVHAGAGRDSATVIAWQSDIRERPTYSSPMPR